MQGDTPDVFGAAKHNASGESTLEALTHGYFSFAGNLLTGNLPPFLSSNQIRDARRGLIELQVCPWRSKHLHAHNMEENVCASFTSLCKGGSPMQHNLP